MLSQLTLFSFLERTPTDQNDPSSNKNEMNNSEKLPSSKKIKCSFQQKWFKSYFGLKYDDARDHMYREICHNLKFTNTLSLGTNNFHFSDCERAFSAQNFVTTHLRNRLSPYHCGQLMRVMIQAPVLQF